MPAGRAGAFIFLMNYILRHGRKIPVEVIGTPFKRNIRDSEGTTSRVVIRIKYTHNNKKTVIALSNLRQ